VGLVLDVPQHISFPLFNSLAICLSRATLLEGPHCKGTAVERTLCDRVSGCRRKRLASSAGKAGLATIQVCPRNAKENQVAISPNYCFVTAWNSSQPELAVSQGQWRGQRSQTWPVHGEIDFKIRRKSWRKGYTSREKRYVLLSSKVLTLLMCFRRTSVQICR
jgi:hypothetical protein